MRELAYTSAACSRWAPAARSSARSPPSSAPTRPTTSRRSRPTGRGRRGWRSRRARPASEVGRDGARHRRAPGDHRPQHADRHAGGGRLGRLSRAADDGGRVRGVLGERATRRDGDGRRRGPAAHRAGARGACGREAVARHLREHRPAPGHRREPARRLHNVAGRRGGRDRLRAGARGAGERARRAAGAERAAATGGRGGGGADAHLRDAGAGAGGVGWSRSPPRANPARVSGEPFVEFAGAGFRVAGGQAILRGLSLAVAEGETIAMIGRSGSGKTTALKLVNALLVPTDGEVRVAGRATTAWDPIRLRRRTGYVIQEVGLFPHLTVGRNVGLVPELEGWPAERIRTRVEELLQLVGLPAAGFAGRYPHQLSGGQRQRVGVARALAADPPLVLLDEPFGALDPITRTELQREFRGLQARFRKTAIFVTHDMREAPTGA